MGAEFGGLESDPRQEPPIWYRARGHGLSNHAALAGSRKSRCGQPIRPVRGSEFDGEFNSPPSIFDCGTCVRLIVAVQSDAPPPTEESPDGEG